MKEYTLITIYAILTAIIILATFVIRRERKLILKAEKKIAEDLTDANEILNSFYGKLDELVEGFKEIDGKDKPEPETPQICYKTNEACKYDCKGLCRESM